MRGNWIQKHILLHTLGTYHAITKQHRNRGLELWILFCLFHWVFKFDLHLGLGEFSSLQPEWCNGCCSSKSHPACRLWPLAGLHNFIITRTIELGLLRLPLPPPLCQHAFYHLIRDLIWSRTARTGLRCSTDLVSPGLLRQFASICSSLTNLSSGVCSNLLQS